MNRMNVGHLIDVVEVCGENYCHGEAVGERDEGSTVERKWRWLWSRAGVAGLHWPFSATRSPY